jgi:tetratricopeptide (TPR) repeat protein
LNQLGRLLSLSGKLDASEPYLKEGLQIRRSVLGEDNFEVCASRGALAGLYKLQKRFDSSRALYSGNIVSLKKLVGGTHHYYGASLSSLADIERLTHNSHSADTLYQQAYEVLANTLPEDHVNLATPLVGRGLLYTDMGRLDEAEVLLDRAIVLRSDHYGDHHASTAEAELAKADMYMSAMDFNKALELYEGSLKVMFENHDSDHPRVKRAFLGLERALVARGDTLGLDSLRINYNQ